MTDVGSTFVSFVNYCCAHIALVLCAVISLNVLAVPLSYLNFKLHQDYYATVLCENPEKPITVCGGICYLKKQLPQSSDVTSPTFTSKIDISVYFQALVLWTFPVLPVSPPTYAPYVVSLLSTDTIPPFRPPQV